MSRGALSVIIPNYNHSQFIPVALTAVLGQSRRPLEVIVIDDGSTDNSVEVIESFVQRDPIVRLIRNERNLGIMASVARGLDTSCGEYLFFHSADDRILPGFFEKSLHMLTTHPEAGLSFAYDSRFDGATGEVTANTVDLSTEPCYLTPRQLAANHRWHVGGHTAILRRSAFTESGGYRPELRSFSDWFCHLIIMFRHGACFLPECLSLYRMTPTAYQKQVWQDRNLRYEILANMLRLLISPEYRDVLPIFQSSRVLRELDDLVHAACEAQIEDDKDIVPLLATVDGSSLVRASHDGNAKVSELGRRALDYKLLHRFEGDHQQALAALYRENYELRLQLRELEKFVALVRNSAPFTLRRRLVAAMSPLTRIISHSRFSNWLREGRRSVRPSVVNP